MSAAPSRPQAYAIVAAARGWLGTPYIHQASTRGQGADCLGLIRGVWREIVGPEPETAPAYTPDWSEPSGQERLWQAALRHLTPRQIDLSTKGDVVLFRMRMGYVAKHVGILAGAPAPGDLPRVIHAYSGRGVVETALSPAWQRRIVAQFSFPDRRA